MNKILDIFLSMLIISILISMLAFGPTFLSEFMFNLKKEELGLPFSFSETQNCSTIVKNLVELENV